MKIKKVILFVGIILLNFQSFADSPLTSIQFWSKDDGAMVIKASKSNGKINNNIGLEGDASTAEVMAFLQTVLGK